MNIGLFTKCFLEPTHVAIAQVLRGLPEHSFHIFAKAYDEIPGFKIPNATPVADLSRELCRPDLVKDCSVVQAIYDGHLAFDAFQLSRELNRPFILSFHGGFDTNAKMWKPAMRDMTRTIAEKANVVTVVAESDVTRLRSLGVVRPIDVVPVPIVLSNLPNAIPASRGELVCIGRLIPKKGFDTAITALKYLPDDFRLKLIGSGPELGSLQGLAKNLGVSARVEFLGFLPVPEMLRVLSRASVLVHPARVAEDGNAEGTPQVVLWSYALGVPVVAGDSGSLRDVVIDGVTGRIVPPNEPRMLATVAFACATNEAERATVIPVARDWVKGRHELSLVLDRWREIYLRAARTDLSISVGETSLSALIAGKSPRIRTAFDAAVASLRDPNVECSLIESGGQGMIFLARLVDGTSVILKVANYTSDDPSDVALTEHRVRKEAAVLIELQRRKCALVPRIHALDTNGRFLIREFFPGATIQDAALNLPQRERARLLPLLAHTCSILFDTFHAGNPEPYVIRDLKPKNLVLVNGPTERIVLVDVGSVRPAGRRSKSSRRKIRLGTRNWLHWSPELLLSKGLQADERSDFFSFGTTAFFFLLARAPFSNSEEDATRAMERYVMEYEVARRDWLSQCNSLGIATPLAELVATCLNPRSDERPKFFPVL